MRDFQFSFSRGEFDITDTGRLCVTGWHRPEADDVKALQQELSSLHIVMEKSTSEYTKQIDELTKAKALTEEEKIRFNFSDK